MRIPSGGTFSLAFYEYKNRIILEELQQHMEWDLHIYCVDNLRLIIGR